MASQAQAKYTISADDKTAGVLRNIEQNFKRHMGKLSSYGKTMTMTLSAPIAAFGILSLKTAADYETSMNRVEGVTGATAAEMAKLKEQAKQLGAQTSFSASQAGDAMGFLAQAGFKTNQILGAMPSTLQLAEASQMDLAAAADITSNILAGYGKQVSDLAHINDVLVKAADATNTDIAGLGEAMSYVAPVASGLGIAFEEAVGALGMLSNAGIKGSMAGTTLRESLSALAKPSKEAADLLKTLGVKAFDSKGKMLPLVNVIGQLQMSGATAGEMLTIFGERAGPGMMALVKQGAGALVELQGELENSGGSAKKMADVQMKGLNGALKNLQSAFEGLQIALVESGILEWVTNFITRLGNWISTAMTTDDQTKKLVLTIIGWVAAAGPLLTIMGKVAAIVGFLTSPIGAVIGAIGLMVLAWAKWGDDIKVVIQPALDWVREEFDKIVNFILTMSDVLHGWGVGMYAMRAEALAAANKDGTLLESTLDRIKKFYEDLKATLVGLGSAVPPVAVVVTELGDTVDEAASAGGLGFLSWIKTLQQAVPLWAQWARGIGVDLKVISWSAKATSKLMFDSFADAAKGMADAIGDAVFRSQNLLEGLAETARTVFATLLSGLIKIGLASVFPSLAPAWGFVDKPEKNMTGGPLRAMQPSWVGENGRELFVPGTSGTVMPGDQVGGSVTNIYQITVHAEGNVLGDPLAFRNLAAKLQREMEIISRTFYVKPHKAGA